MTSLSYLDLITHGNSLEYGGNDGPSMFNPPIENTHVDIAKSFRNASGFYKLNGTLENNGFIIHSHIVVVKYYKILTVNDTTLVCYERQLLDCQYKSNDNQLPLKRFFLTMPPNPLSEPSFKSN